MGTKSTNRPDSIGEPVAYFPASSERRSLAPWEVKRPRWRPGQRIRALSAEVATGDVTASVWLEHRDHQGLAFRLEVDARGGLVSFYVRPLAFVGEYSSDGSPIIEGGEVDEHGLPDGAPRVTATLLDSVPVGALHDAAVAAVGRLGQVVPVDAPDERKRTRRSGIPDVKLAEFARDYAAACSSGVTAPLRAVAEAQHLSYDGAQYRRRQAERRGLLEKPRVKGVAGGRLTAKARALLGD